MAVGPPIGTIPYLLFAFLAFPLRKAFFFSIALPMKASSSIPPLRSPVEYW